MMCMKVLSDSALQLVLTASVVYVPCLGFAKISLLLLYCRIVPQKSLQSGIYLVMTVVIGYSFALVFALIFSCRPIAKAWDASISTGTCINRPAVYYATAIVNIVTDLAILGIPIPVVWKLQMPTQQKIGLILMFTVGSAYIFSLSISRGGIANRSTSRTVFTSIIRLVTLRPLLTAIDQSWEVAQPAMWIVVEASLVIVCGCLPTLKQFLRRHAPALIGERTRSKGTHKTPYSGDNRIFRTTQISQTNQRRASAEPPVYTDDFNIAMGGLGFNHKRMSRIMNQDVATRKVSDVESSESKTVMEVPDANSIHGSDKAIIPPKRHGQLQSFYVEGSDDSGYGRP